MFLTAWAQGSGSNWVGFDTLKQVNPVLDIPEEIELLALLPFGYSVEAIGKGQKNRKLLSEIAHHEWWSEPFAEEVPVCPYQFSLLAIDVIHTTSTEASQMK